MYDPAWDMPQINWKQQGSYEQGSIPPIIEPDAGTQVCLGPIAREWIPWIAGACDQLRNPSAWLVADDTAMYNTLRRVDTLLGLLFGGTGCEVPVMTRLQDCVLQTSSDGGTTWVDVPGWVDNFASCVRDAIPPPPPNIGPTPIQQRACNIAGYLATEVIQRAMSNAVADWNAGARTLHDATSLFNQYVGFAFPITSFALTAFDDFWGFYSASTIAGFTSAASDEALWSEVTCAIYTVIKSDGAVTDANYSSIVANVCALSYGTAHVIDAICAFITALGAVNLRALQVTGAVFDIDCTACGAGDHLFNFTIDQQGWVLSSFRPDGSYSAGLYWLSTDRGDGYSAVSIEIALPHPMVITGIDVQYSAHGAGDGGRRALGYSGSTIVWSLEPDEGPYDPWHLWGSLTGGGTIDRVVVYLDSGTPATNTCAIQKVCLQFNGPDPFPTPAPCVFP